MSDTPETDANEEAINYKETYGYECSLHEQIIVWPEFARKLERERDEVRNQLIHLRSCVYDVIHSLKAGAFDDLEKAWKEGLK
jgi:hypothetical protein